MNKNFSFYDSYERHRKIANLIANNQTILDVGGQLGALSQFIKGKKVTVANVAGSEEKSDVTISGKKLPFKDNSFDCVCAIDVLEHIPQKDRESFINEIVRVALNSAVLSFPLGTPRHLIYEKKLQSQLEKKGVDVTYLKEHIKYKLPTVEQVEKICKSLKYTLSYSGEIKANNYLFKFFVFDPKIKFVRRANYHLKLLANGISNPLLYHYLSNRKYTSDVNRAYLVIEK